MTPTSGSSNEVGEAALVAATRLARDILGDRLIGAFALGSLAHGGFLPSVSDVDLGLILGDPLEAADADKIERLRLATLETKLALSDKLSIFWGTPSSLSGATAGGRFPPYDRADLLEHGRLLEGRDARGGLPRPDQKALDLDAAQMAIRLIGRADHPERAAPGDPWALPLFDRPKDLIAQGARHLTKRILFPVRFLYTLRTGKVGRTDEATAMYLASATGPTAALVAAAMEWRLAAPVLADAAAVKKVAEGLVPLYQEFLREYERRMRVYGEDALGCELSAWSTRLAVLKDRV